MNVWYVDYRGDGFTIHQGGKEYQLYFDRTGEVVGRDRNNFPNLPIDSNMVWPGVAPVLEWSGPDMQRQPVKVGR